MLRTDRNSTQPVHTVKVCAENTQSLFQLRFPARFDGFVGAVGFDRGHAFVKRSDGFGRFRMDFGKTESRSKIGGA